MAASRTVAVAAILSVATAAGIAIARYGMGRPTSVDTRPASGSHRSRAGRQRSGPSPSASAPRLRGARRRQPRPPLLKLSPDARPVRVTQGSDRDRPSGRRMKRGSRSSEKAIAGTLRVASSDGSRARDLSCPALPRRVADVWSPDGLSLASPPAPLPSRRRPTSDRHPRRRQRRTLTHPPAAHRRHGPAFSPDGRQVAFVRSIGGGLGDVFVVPVDGGTPARASSDNAGVLGVDWEPDGRHLVFSLRSQRRRQPVARRRRRREPTLLAGGGADQASEHRPAGRIDCL